MDSPASINDSEIAEVIALIEELRSEPKTLEQGLALCRSISTLIKTPKLSLHGVMVLSQSNTQSDKQLVNKSLQEIAETHRDVRWVQFRCGYHFGDIGLIERGIDCYEQAIALKPTVKAHHQVAMLHKRLMQFEPCIAHLEKALAKNPDHNVVRSELLYLMAMKGDLPRFHALVQEGTITDNHRARCFNRLGETLVHLGRRREAIQWFDKAIEITPESFGYQWSRHLTVPTIYRTQEDLVASRQQYLSGLEKINWLYDRLSDEEKKVAHHCAQKLTNFEIHYQSENDMEVQQRYGQLFHRIMSHSLPEYMQPMALEHPGKARRIRVGFASWGGFFTHSNYKTHGTWITDLNRERFEVFGYELGPTVDQTTKVVRSKIEHSIPFRGNAQQLRKRIKNDQLDILVYPGIGMEPIVHCLAPLRLAPVQCTSWGHPVTSGLPNIDYYLSSDLMEPDNAQDNYTEKLVRLPNLGISQIAPGIPNEFRSPELLRYRKRPATVFFCSQNILKMLPQHDFLFARVLQAVPDSEIWFISSKRQDFTDTFIERMRKTCQSYGVDYEQRCVMLPRLGKAEFCWANQNADVMLDTPFWSGCNTTFESLVFGTPVITLRVIQCGADIPWQF